MVGLFIGIALGLALAAAVAFYLMKGANPYQSATPAREPPREATKELAKAGRADPSEPEKPRFDFYRILPGAEEAKVRSKPAERGLPDKSTAERAISPDKADAKPPNKNEAAVVAKAEERAPTAAPDTKAKAAERFWLQAGSFANEADAEDLKARLAFAGWEASIQLATLPDKSARYRVRLGPYDNTDALQRMKSNLAARGFDVAVIKF